MGQTFNICTDDVVGITMDLSEKQVQPKKTWYETLRSECNKRKSQQLHVDFTKIGMKDVTLGKGEFAHFDYFGPDKIKVKIVGGTGMGVVRVHHEDESHELNAGSFLSNPEEESAELLNQYSLEEFEKSITVIEALKPGKAKIRIKRIVTDHVVREFGKLVDDNEKCEALEVSFVVRVINKKKTPKL